MRRFNKSKKAAILASVLGSSLFVSSAFAANLLITVPSDYTSSNMAVITGSRVTSDVDSKPIRGALESLNRDPSAYAFVMDGKSMFLLRQYNYSTSTLIPSQVLDADVDWNNPVSATGTITKAANPHSAIGKNGYLYTGDYDLGTISVSRVNGKSLKEEVEKTVDLLEDINNYCGGSLSKAQHAWVHGEGLQIKGDSLYVVVSVNPKGGYDPYDDSYLMEYKINSDGSLTLNSYTRSVRNPDSVRLENYNNLLMHTGIGGYQNVGAGNSTTGITIADVGGGKLSEKATRTVVLPENVQANGLDLRNMSVWPNGTVYILAYNLSSSGGGSQMTVYKTTVANLNSDNPKNWEEIIKRSPEGGGDSGVATGWFNSFFGEYYTKRLWGEFGNDIVVYKDGDSQPSLSWTAKDLANNNIYHTFNSVALLKGDAVTGEKALLTKTTEEGLTSPFSTMTSVVNMNANMKKADYNKQISGTAKDSLYAGVTSDNKTYTFDTDKVIGLGTNSWKDQADLSNNILAAIYAHDGNDLTIDAGKNTLQLQVQNYIASPVGVYAGNGKNVTVNAGQLNIITSGVAGGNSLTNAIMNDAGKDKASNITINGDVNITMSGGYGGNGVAVQKTDRWGEASYASSVENSITINGDLNIKGADSDSWGIPLNEENALSRFNNAGILAQVENSRVDVSGAANMDVYGNGITTNAKNSTVSIGGGEINVPTGMKYGYYTLGAYQGTINVNTGKNGESVGANDVKLGGDIFALKTGTINVALTTADSYLHGIVDNGGTVNLWLQNGASWTNVKNNDRYEQDNEDVGSNGLSHVTKLVGGSAGNEGVIFQQAGSKDITVDNYSGSTMLIYGHDSKTPTSILGGNFTIGNAAAGSEITLRTDSSGIDMSSDTDKNAVLNALANKLYYTGFTKGENNLSGYVQLAEGLTAASESVFVGSIKYSSADGQGSLDGSGEGAKAEKPSGNNSEKDKNFLVENDSWKGSNSGDNVKLTLKNSSSWNGDNSGKNLHINATESTWKGNNSGAGANITLIDSVWTGSNTAEDTKLTLDGASEWLGGNTGTGFTLNLLDNSTWKVQGDTVIDIFNSGSNLRMRAAGGPVVDMTDAAAGNVVVNTYNGDATVLYAHDAKDSTKMLGGNFTVKKAAAGSSITLVTDNSGVEASNKYSINDTLNALANKLYYTASTTGEKNLSGTVKIAEGLTAVSAAKHMGNIAYGKDGQGSLDKSSVDYGKDFPTVQNKTGFTSSVTGDYVTDKEYRDAGVLSDTNNIYNFTKDATTITTAGSAVTTAKDTTLQLNKHDLTITANSGDGIAATGGTLTVKDAGSLSISGAKAINANNSKVDITAVNATLNGDVSTNNIVSVKAAKAAKVNGAVSAKGANSSVSINGGEAATITGAVSADGANAAVTIDSANTTIGSDITANGKAAKVTAKSISKLDGNVTTAADGSVELTFKDGAAWSGNNAGNTTMSLSKGSWNGANSGKLNATLTNGTTWTGDSSGAGSTIKLDASTWNGANSGDNTTITAGNGTSWNKGNSGANANITLNASNWTGENTADGVTVTADKSTWTGNNSGKALGVTLTNGASWTGDSSGANATVNLTDSSWTGDNSGAGLSLTANNSKWNGNANAAGSAVLTNGSVWTGASTSGDFSLTLNNSTWNNSGASSLKSFSGTNGVVDMTNAAGSVTIGSYSGDATVIYKHNSSNPAEVYGGNFTVNKAAANSKITMLTDNTGVDTTDEDKINEALDALAGKLFYTGAIGGAENNLNGTVKIAEGLTAASVAKQTAGIVYDKTTGQGSADHKTVTPGPVYPTEQDRTAFVTSITGEHLTDKEYRKAGVLSNTVDNNIYSFTKDATTITTDSSAVTTAKDTTLQLNNHDMTITANSGDGIATTGGTLTVKDAGSLTVTGAKAINANNSKVDITAVNVALNGDVSTNSAVSIKAAKAAKVNGAVSANGANSSVSINGTESAAITGAVSADGANSTVTIDSANTTIGSDITANGKDAKVTAKSISKLDGNVTTAADSSVELTFKEGAAWSGDNAGNTTMSLSKGSWNGANTGKLNATLTNGTTWTGDSSGAGSTITLDASTWNGANSGDNTTIIAGNGASWSKGNSGAHANITLNASNWTGENTGDNVTVKADKTTWTGNNSGKSVGVTLTNGASWNGANSGANTTINLTDSSWTGDNSGAGLSLTANNSKWNGSTNAAGSAVLTNGSVWSGASTSADFSLTLNGSTWNNSGASSLKSFTGTNGIVDMTNAATSVTIGSYSGDATVIYKHNSSNPSEVYGGNFTVNKAAANSKITMLTDNTGVDTTDEDKINEALDALAGKLFYTGAIGGAENNLNGTVKIAEGLTAASVAKQTAGIVYDKITGQGSADHKTVTPGPVYPTEQDRTAFVTSITGEHLTDKEYRKAGVLSNTVDNNIYNFTKDATTITTAGSAVTTAKDTRLQLNKHDMTITANSGDGIATTGGTLTVKDAGSLTVTGAKAINANNSKVDITAVNATLNGDVSTNSAVSIKAAKAAKVNGAVSANGANAAVSINGTDSVAIAGAVSANGANAAVIIDSANTTIASDITANGKDAKVTAKNLSKLDGNVTTDADGSVELTFKEGAAWSGDNAGNTTMSLSKGSWNGANTGKLNATLTNGTIWTGDSSGAGSTITLDASTWNGANSGANAVINLTDSSWTGDNSGAGVVITADNSKWNGNANAAGSAVLTNGSVWTGASTSADFSLTLNGSTWNNSGASSLKSFTGTNGVVDMTNAAASVTIGSYSGDATVIYKHNSSNPAEVYGGNFTVNSAKNGSKITMLTDNTGVDTTDEDKINEALDALAGKLFYTGAIGGAENNLNGTVKIAEGLTAASVAKQSAGIVYDKTTGQGSADHKSVTPGPVYPTEQDRTAFVTSITGEHLTDKEYRKAGVLSNTVDNNIYNFTKDATTITTDSSAVTTAKDTTLQLNNHDLTITANSGDGIAATGGTLTVKDAGSLTVSGAKAINANNSKVDITAVNATLNGDVSTNKAVSIKAAKAAKVNGAVSASGANSSVSISGEAANITGAVSADGANAAVTIDSADTTIGSDITANGKGAKVTAKSLSKLDGDVTTDADGSVELTFKEGAAWTGDNGGNTTMSLSKGSWNGANTGKLNAALTNGTAWTGDSSGAGSKIKLDASTWNGANGGDNADVTLSNGASWTKGNTADGVTVKADKANWNGANGGANANITLTNASTWNGANSGANAVINLTDSSWTGDNSGAGLSLTANNSKWNGSANAAGSAALTNGSIWTGASTSADFSLTLNGSTWNSSGVSSLKSFNGTNGVVDMTNAAASVTIGSYSGDATVIYKHNSSNPAEVHGGNFTVNKAAANSKITMLTDNTGVDTTDEDKINEALDALAGKLFYTGAIGGAENNLNGTVKIAEGLTAVSAAKQSAGIVYDKTTGQGSADHKSVTPGPVYPTEQDRTAFVTSITGEHLTDKEYRKAGVLSNTVDNNIYNFTKDATTITTDSSAVTTAKDTTLELNKHDLTITANSGDGIATTGGTLTVKDAGSLTVNGAKAINANNSKVDITAVNATLNGDVSTNNIVSVKATKAAKVNGAVSASGANSSVSISGEAANITGAVSADGANSTVTIDSADTTIGSDITANGKGAKVTAKSLSKLDGDVATDTDGSVELNFKEGAVWTGNNAGNTTMSLSKGNWNGANTGKLNATLTNGTAWTGDSSGAGSTIKLDASTWNGTNSGENADITLTNGASWTKGNTADGVTVKADKAAWTGANGGANTNITLTNASTWNGANSGANAVINLTDSSWTGDNSGAGVVITADNSKWNGNANAAGSAVLTNGSVWTGASTSADFSLTLNGSTWNNSGASSLKSFTGTNGVVDMTNAAASVTIGSYSGDATVIYKHNSSNPAEVYGGNFTVNKAAANSKITMLTDNTGVDTTDEDKINEALDALAGKLFYTGAIGGAENNLNGTVKIAEGLTAVSAAKQSAGIVYDKTTGQGSADHKSVTPGPVYPTEQDRTAFVTSITGEHLTDKEYRKAGVLSNTVDNNIYNFTKDATTITTAGNAVTTAKDTTLQLNKHDLTITANSGDGIATTGGTLAVKDAGSLTVNGAKAINANNSKVDITAVNATLNGDVSTNKAVSIKATKAAKVNGAVSASGANSSVSISGEAANITGALIADGANAAVTLDSADTTIGSDIAANGKGAKVTAKSLSKLDGKVTTDADGSVELSFKEGAVWTGDNGGNTTMSLSKGSWNGANTGKLNAALTNGTAWTGDSSGAGSTIKLDASTWNGANSGANAVINLTDSSWTKGNTADGVTVKADKAAWTGANGGANTNITLTNASTWNGANSGANAVINLTDSSWTGDNSGAGLSLTANNSKWNGSANAAGSAALTNGSIWTGASTSADFSLTLNGSTWNNSGASSLKSFSGTNGVVDMTNAAASVTIGSYSGDATVIYKHNSSNPAEVYGGNFTVNKAAANSKITMLTDRSGVDFSNEDSIANVLNALANKLYYTGYINGERNLIGYVKLAEGLTASAVVKQTGDIAYNKVTGQGSLKDGSVTPNVTYPEEQTKDNFTSQITGEWKLDKEYKLAGVLHTDNAVYDFKKDRSVITTSGTSVGAGKDLQLQLNNKSMSLYSGADAIKADAITIKINDVDKLDITAKDKALLAENGGQIIINNKGLLSGKNALAVNGAGSAIKVNGLVNIDTGKNDALTAADGSIQLAGGSITGNVNAAGAGAVNVNVNEQAAASNTVKVTGDINAADNSVINIGLSNEESSLKGNVTAADAADVSIYAKNRANWTGTANGNVSLTLDNKASWNNIGDSTLKKLSGAGGFIDQTQSGAGNITVADYSGDVTVLYKHDLSLNDDGSIKNINFSGGNFTVDKAAKDSSITLKTDRNGITSLSDTANIEKLMDELSKKLFYNDATANADNLKGTLVISEGLTAASASKAYGTIQYNEHGQGGYKEGSFVRTDPEIIYGNSETAMMRGAKSAMASTALLWRTEANDMQKRIGDIRLAGEESGLWAKYYGGKTSYDANNTKYQTSFNAYQLGYDKNIDKNLILGTSISYNKGSNTYELGGRGDGKAISVAAYGTWLGERGHYADVIIKGSKLDNDYKVFNDMGHKLEGDYDTWGLSMSAEYGRRLKLQNDYYVEPSVEFSIGRVAAADYSAASDFLDAHGKNKYMSVKQDAFTSAIGRLGIGFGKITEKSTFYTKLAWAHEFSGDFTTTFAAEGEPTSGTKVDFSGSWYEWQIGGSVNVNDNSYVYATFEKKFGGDAGSNDWRLDAGLRWSF